MKNPPVSARSLLCAFLSSVAATAMHAQAVAPTPATPGPSAAAKPDETAVVLSPFVITTDADDGYSSTESASASRFTQKLKDIPQTISIMSGQFLKDIGAVDLADVMPLIGGTVSAGARSQDSFSIRGFAVQESYLDGFRDVKEWGGGDFVHVQQLEIIKGPSSNLYGNPKGLGGIINRVSKLPRDRQWQQVGLTVGDYANYHFTADVTGPINDRKTLLYRVNAAYRNLEYNRDFKDLERVFVAPVVEWRATPATKVSLFGEIMRQEYQEDAWIPSALVAPGVRALTVPDTRRIDEPWAESKIEREKLRLTVEHKINDHLTARVAGQQTYINNPITQAEFIALAADNRTVTRQAFWLNRWEDYSFAEANLFGRYQTGRVEHSVILAADYYLTDFRSNVRRVPYTAIDLLAPVYNNTAPAFPAANAVTNTLGESITTGYTGTYQLNAFSGRVILIGGWRDTKVEDSRYVELGAGPFPRIVEPAHKAELPRYGALVRPLKNLALYYQYSEVFQPQGGGALRIDGSPLAPITASSEEFGIRLSFLGEKLNLEAVKYEMVSDGIAQRLPPPNASFFENGGQTTSDGWEYTLTYNDRRLMVQAGWVDVFVRDTTPGVLGAQIGGQPRYRGQLHARYKFPQVGRHGGLSIGATAIHTGDRPLSATTTGQVIPSFDYYNVNANYNLAKGVNVALAVGNVFDERAIVGNNGILWRPLDPRTVKLTITRSW